MDPSFIVPAEYFYVLYSTLPPNVSRDTRYELVTALPEEQIVSQLRQAIEDGVISDGLPVTPEQAARRLRALGVRAARSAPECEVDPGTPLFDLVEAWLDYQDPDPPDDPAEDIEGFWQTVPTQPNLARGHFQLVLCAITSDHAELTAAIEALAESIAEPNAPTVDTLTEITEAQWRALFHDDEGNPILDLLPEFTKPGTPQERIDAFIRHVRRFLVVTGPGAGLVENPSPDAPPLLDLPASEPLQSFIFHYTTDDGVDTGIDFRFGEPWDPQRFATAVGRVFPQDPQAQAWLVELLRTIDDLYRLTDVAPPELRFAIMEGLYARGITGAASIQGMTLEELRTALVGTVAHDHAEAIYANADANPSTPPSGLPGAHAINPDGSLTNCIPPPHLSPLGPVAYLHEMLRVSAEATCDDPHGRARPLLGDALASRRPLGQLTVTLANLQTPLPLIDIVNENLEALAAHVPESIGGVVYETPSESLDGFLLAPPGSDPETVAQLDPGDEGSFRHDPSTLLATLPAHSSPATPVALPTAYDRLRTDFSAPSLPYAQAVDINRSYLCHLRTSRFEVMRLFRRDITELVLDPDAEPPEFQRHLWRLPVRLPIALEYLGMSPEEYETIFVENLDVPLAELYGFPPGAGIEWTAGRISVSDFLDRTGLDYCHFLELWRSRIVPFRRVGDVAAFEQCEPCYFDRMFLQFEVRDPEQALRRLFVVIRLWRMLQCVEGARYTFSELRDITEVLRPFDDQGVVDPDFPRQLAAFQMLRDELGLALVDEDDDQPAQGTGADRTHLLALWVGEDARKWSWAVAHLLERIQYRAQAVYHCGCRPPEVVELLAASLDPLSRLAGFDPDHPQDTWHARPTHTLRFAEVLSKIYASEFTADELLFLFTTDDPLAEGPFPLQTERQALEHPLDLPAGEDEHSLWSLRCKLLAVDPCDLDVESWTWPRIEASLRREFGYEPEGGVDRLLSLGAHFFPSILTASGQPVGPLDRQYRTPLDGTSAAMWNTPPIGPFFYDSSADELWTQVPLLDSMVLAKLGRVRPLDADEQQAVRDLYFMPRLDLAHFAFMFPNLGEADERLVQEPDEAERWRYFQSRFALVHARAEIIARHLAEHVAAVTEECRSPCTDVSPQSVAVAWQILRRLLAAENRAQGASWESDAGAHPPVAWGPRPVGSAFAALLGLTGTGLLGLFQAFSRRECEEPVWRELRGPMEAFTPVRNAWNAPVPTIIPAMDFTLTPEHQHLVSLRNGFALGTADGTPLGGAQGFAVEWDGMLMVDEPGRYGFWAGAPTPMGEVPDFDAAAHQHWRVVLERGRRRWVVLSHRWPEHDDAPAACSAPVCLERGAYRIVVELVQPELAIDDPVVVCARPTGFQLKYAGPDSGGCLVALPHHRLFLACKQAPLDEGLAEHIDGVARAVLQVLYPSTLSDMRCTYQRAFKAALFAQRFDLSAQPTSDTGQSELEVLLEHGASFAGRSYYRTDTGFAVHRASFDFDFLPVRDCHLCPTDDQRVTPSLARQQAMFDWWERIFDHTRVRAEARAASEPPAWLLYHEAAEKHPDDPAHLLRHLDVHLLHAPLVLQYFAGQEESPYVVSSDDLESEAWALRVLRADRGLRRVWACSPWGHLELAQPHRWASDDPGQPVAGTQPTGNEDLTSFVYWSAFGGGEPRRYEAVEELDDGLRERARAALITYLTRMDRVPLPWGGHAQEARDLSALLLLDVEAGLCQRASRIEEAISAVQIFVQRARLGLEPDWVMTPELALLWDRRFASFHQWQSCKRRELYRENWIEWDELEAARRTEAFRLFETELRRRTLTVPVPGGLVHWANVRPPPHPGLVLLQERERADMQRLSPPREGFDLLGTPERHGRTSWLASLPSEASPDDGRPDGERPPSDPDLPPPAGIVLPGWLPSNGELPLWIEAAVRLGAHFVRVAAAGTPPASTSFEPSHVRSGCCVECGREHDPLVDEYYFWIIDTRRYDLITQDANLQTNEGTGSLAWHDETQLPSLLHWPAERMVHLMWSRVHDGALTQPRRSVEGVRVAAGQGPDLRFLGRRGDSLAFEVVGGEAPVGYALDAPPGFRYDLATDSAVVLPSTPLAHEDEEDEDEDEDEPQEEAVGPFAGGLPAHPYFAYFAPGASLVPSSFSPVVLTADVLRARCRFEAALEWYRRVFDPLHHDARWCHRGEGPPTPVPPAGGPTPPEPEGPDTDEPRPPAVPLVVAPNAECCGAATSDTVARHRAITLHYLETLLQWGEAVMREGSPAAFQRARQIFDAARTILGASPRTVVDVEAPEPAPTVSDFSPLVAPLNPRLVSLYERVEDRLSLIHACLDARRLPSGQPRTDARYWGSDPVRDGWQTAAQLCLDEGDWCRPRSPYRFTVLVQRAVELANDVRNFGSALLSALEKGDAEQLAALRTDHEGQIAGLTLANRQNAVREALWQIEAQRTAKASAQTRRRYFQSLLERGLVAGEAQYEALTGVAIGLRVAGMRFGTIAQVMNLIPDFFVGSPGALSQIPVGTKLAEFFRGVERVLGSAADISNTTASLRVTQAGWERREEEWRHQVEVLDLEIEQIEYQILAAERRRDIALRELEIQQRQIEQNAEILGFLRDRFTSQELYAWLQRELAALHDQMHEIALDMARQAQRALNYELGHTTMRMLPSAAWDDLHEGLQAGEQLLLAVRRMEATYLTHNVREYELTTHVSLRLRFPMAFLQLLVTGACEFELPEWMFDMEHPGHYMRRIKRVSVTIPAVVGPHTTVNARLILLSSQTRVDPRLREPVAACCEPPPAPPRRPCRDWSAIPRVPSPCPDPLERRAERRREDGRTPTRNGYLALPDDPRIVKEHAPTQAIATSSGQNDAGLFVLDFRDERYLPFEFAGAVSRWRLELPPENNYFDLQSLSDVVMHIDYTAREGGEVLRAAAREATEHHLPGSGRRLFDLERDFSSEWRRLQGRSMGCPPRRHLCLEIGRHMFPYVPGHHDLWITRLELLFETCEPEPGCQRVVRFTEHRPGCPSARAGHVIECAPTCKPGCAPTKPDCAPSCQPGDLCEARSIVCVASKEWPGLYHGVLDVRLGPLNACRDLLLGTLEFPPELGEIARAFLVCGYALDRPEDELDDECLARQPCAPGRPASAGAVVKRRR